MRKRAGLIENTPSLKALRGVERKKLMEEVQRLDKIPPSGEIKDIPELNDTIQACALYS